MKPAFVKLSATSKALAAALAALLALALAGTGAGALSGCSSTQALASEALMENVEAGNVEAMPAALDGPAATAAADFAVALFQQGAAAEGNVVMSPLSVLYALGMAANGMDGETLAQTEQVLGAPVADVNAYLHALDQSLAEPYVATGAAGSIGGANVAGTTEGAGGDADATGGAADAGAAASPLKLANALWIRDGFEVEQAFLQTNADYYAAGAFRAAFDQGTARDINAWVSENTDGMVENLIGEIPAEAVLYLVNALAFDADWASPYTEDAVRDGTFAAADGTAQEARMMFSTEHHYLEDGEAVGFVKPYAYEESPFAFAAILPPEGMSVQDYAATLDGGRLQGILEGLRDIVVHASMPKFESEYAIDLADGLSALGMPDAFDAGLADFARLSPDANGLYIGSVLHKAHIAVDEQGTKAGAATAMSMNAASAMAPEDEKTVHLDRPFLYLIIDQRTNFPVFMGILNTLE